MSAEQVKHVAAGRIVVREGQGELILEHRGKSGEVVSMRIDPKVLERWVVRQLRQEVFA